MLHGHISSWVLAVVLLLISIALYKSGKQKGGKIVQMILRVSYLLIILSGMMMTNMSGQYLLKAVVGLWVIVAMEMLVVKTAKQEKTLMLWIQFVVSFALVLYIGFKVPFLF